MSDVQGMQCQECLAHVLCDLRGNDRIKRAGSLDRVRKGLARHVVVHRHKPIGHLIGGRDLWQARARGAGQRRPHGPVGALQRHLLAHKRSRVLNGHQLCNAVGVANKHALHAVCIVDAHGMHYLLAVQPGNPPPIARHTASPPRDDTGTL